MLHASRSVARQPAAAADRAAPPAAAIARRHDRAGALVAVLAGTHALLVPLHTSAGLPGHAPRVGAVHLLAALVAARFAAGAVRAAAAGSCWDARLAVTGIALLAAAALPHLGLATGSPMPGTILGTAGAALLVIVHAGRLRRAAERAGENGAAAAGPVPPAAVVAPRARADLPVGRVAAGAVRRAAVAPVRRGVAVAVTLRDGTPARLRPLMPWDREQLVRGLRRLSPASRYQRFHAPVVELDEWRLRYLTELDYRDHFAWALFAEEAGCRTGVAVGRWVRLAGGRDAEVALTVLDEYQGRGVGTLLLGALAVAARELGVERLRCSYLRENAGMGALVRAAGGRPHADEPGILAAALDVARLVAPVSTELQRTLVPLVGAAPRLAARGTARRAVRRTAIAS